MGAVEGVDCRIRLLIVLRNDGNTPGPLMEIAAALIGVAAVQSPGAITAGHGWAVHATSRHPGSPPLVDLALTAASHAQQPELDPGCHSRFVPPVRFRGQDADPGFSPNAQLRHRISQTHFHGCG
jgi:hypothetical protein